MEISRDINLLEANFRAKVESFLSQTTDLGVFLTEGHRTLERQQYLYTLGRTRSGSIVTDCDGVQRLSMHQRGLAIDIAFTGGTLYPSDLALWRRVAAIGKQCGMDWGYDLWQTDKPHFQCDGTDFIPAWAEEAVEHAISSGVARVWDTPYELVGNTTLEHILHNLGLIEKVTGQGVTKLRLIVALHRADLF